MESLKSGKWGVKVLTFFVQKRVRTLFLPLQRTRVKGEIEKLQGMFDIFRQFKILTEIITMSVFMFVIVCTSAVHCRLTYSVKSCVTCVIMKSVC